MEVQNDTYVSACTCSPVRYDKFQSIRYFIDIDIFRNLLIDINIFQNLLIDIDIFQNLLIDIGIFQNLLIDIDIDIFQNSLIDIDILKMALSIFSRFADISTIDIDIRYSSHKTGEKTPK